MIFFDVPKWEENSDKVKYFLMIDTNTLLKDARLLREESIKNRILFDSLLQRLKNQKGIKIIEEESKDFYKVQALIVDQINLRELGYLIEMKKLGLKIIDKNN
jgi:hypothetical protein